MLKSPYIETIPRMCCEGKDEGARGTHRLSRPQGAAPAPIARAKVSQGSLGAPEVSVPGCVIFIWAQLRSDGEKSIPPLRSASYPSVRISILSASPFTRALLCAPSIAGCLHGWIPLPHFRGGNHVGDVLMSCWCRRACSGVQPWVIFFFVNPRKAPAQDAIVDAADEPHPRNARSCVFVLKTGRGPVRRQKVSRGGIHVRTRELARTHASTDY